MTNTYVVEKENAIELLNHVEEFIDKMDRFIEKYPNRGYRYSLNIFKNTNAYSKYKWIVEAKIISDD